MEQTGTFFEFSIPFINSDEKGDIEDRLGKNSDINGFEVSTDSISVSFEVDKTPEFVISLIKSNISDIVSGEINITFID